MARPGRCAVLTGVLVAAVLLATAPVRASDLQPVALDMAALGHSAQPNIAVDRTRQRFVLTWQARLPDGCTALRAAELAPGADEIGPVREIARGCDWFVNWADIPALVVADNGDWLAHWLQRHERGGYAYDIRLSRSRDRGRRWSAPFSPHSDGTASQHGFVAMAPVAGGDGDRVLLVWLDGRNGAGAGNDQASHAGHGHDHDDAMALRSAIVTGTGEIHQESELDARVCSCCPTGLVRLDDGRHLAVYRDRSEAEVRDTALAMRGTDGGWRSGMAVHPDNWVVHACPVNGPTLAAAGDRILVAWSTMPDQASLAVRYRLLSAASLTTNTIDASYRVLEQGAGVAGRVAVAAITDGWLMAWLGADGTGSSVLRLARFDAALDEQARVDIAVLPAGRDIGLPRLAVLGDQAVLAWTEVAAEVPPTARGQRRATRLRAVRMDLSAAGED